MGKHNSKRNSSIHINSVIDLNSFSQFSLFIRFIKYSDFRMQRKSKFLGTTEQMWPRLIRWRRSKFVMWILILDMLIRNVI